MNIFVLDEDPAQAAALHKNIHVVKMILETAQILCTVYHRYGQDAPYKPTHKYHPCVVWAGDTTSNYLWLVQLGLALCAEYTRRYDKTHKSEEIIRMVAAPPAGMPESELTPFVQAMPDGCKNKSDPVGAYRSYYEKHKGHLI